MTSTDTTYDGSRVLDVTATYDIRCTTRNPQNWEDRANILRGAMVVVSNQMGRPFSNAERDAIFARIDAMNETRKANQ